MILILELRGSQNNRSPFCFSIIDILKALRYQKCSRKQIASPSFLSKGQNTTSRNIQHNPRYSTTHKSNYKCRFSPKICPRFLQTLPPTAFTRTPLIPESLSSPPQLGPSDRPRIKVNTLKDNCRKTRRVGASAINASRILLFLRRAPSKKNNRTLPQTQYLPCAPIVVSAPGSSQIYLIQVNRR